MTKVDDEIWILVSEFETEGEYKGELVSNEVMRFEVGTYFVPCGLFPTSFRIEGIYSSYQEAKGALIEIHNS